MKSPLEMNDALIAGRVFGPPDLDDVRLSFDWLVPSSIAEPLTFILEIKRGNRESLVRFNIDLAKLESADLRRLHIFLEQRHSGVRDDYTFARGLTMLLSLSLQQQGTPADQVDGMVRDLLLF
jgi:hypothetical protein